MIDPTIQPDPTAALDAGIASTNTTGPGEQEIKDAKDWLKRIEEAREFDKIARERYARDRRYARGDAGDYEVSIPIAGTYVDILKSYLYARDPDVDCDPSDGTTPPPMQNLLDMARQKVASDPNTAAVVDQASQAAAQQATIAAVAPLVESAVGGAPPPAAGPPGVPGAPPAPPVNPQDAAQQAGKAAFDQLAKAQADQLMAPYTQRREDAKQFGQTLESVISSLWSKAKLKAQAEPCVGSGLTVGPGWLKVTWQDRTAAAAPSVPTPDPIAMNAANDLQDNIAKMDAAATALSKGEGDEDTNKTQMEQQAAAAQANVEVLVARGLAIDFVSAEDIQVAPECPTIANYVDSPWIDHRTFMTMDDAKATFPNLVTPEDRLCKAHRYSQRAPVSRTERRDVGSVANVTADEADGFVKGAPAVGKQEFICVHEVWNKSANNILTFIEGVDGYAREPYAPVGSTRFYGFFLFAPTRVDGERHPQSMIQRTESLLDEMNRNATAWAVHRRRTKPKTVFNKGVIDPKDAQALADGGSQEMVGIEPIDPTANLSTAVVPLAYAQIDMAVYDDSKTRAALEMAWGIQEALASTIQTPKTATEAQIQQTGTQARTGYMRDCLEGMLTELGQYTAEVAIQKMTVDDAKQIAGPFAFWPQAMKIDDISALVTVKIRAGTTGKPNTQQQQQAWATILPTVQSAIVQIGQLRGSSPDDVADCLEEVVAETMRRTGDKIDPERFMPRAPSTGGPMPQMSAPIQPPALPAPAPSVPAGATIQ